MIRKIIYTLLILFPAYTVTGQPVPLTSFTEINEDTLPRYGRGDLFDLINSSDIGFTVENKNGALAVYKTSISPVCEFKLPGGKLMGENNGEWGGSLKFVPDDPSKKEIKICSGNIISIFPCKGDLFFLEGLWHLSMHSGALYKIDTLNGSFKCSLIIDFDYPPGAWAVNNDSIFVASGGNIFLVQRSKKEIVHQVDFEINSMVMPDHRSLYLGIKSGYVKVDLLTKERVFYIYKP
jgi:hypothetical protein